VGSAARGTGDRTPLQCDHVEQRPRGVLADDRRGADNLKELTTRGDYHQPFGKADARVEAASGLIPSSQSKKPHAPNARGFCLFALGT